MKSTLRSENNSSQDLFDNIENKLLNLDVSLQEKLGGVYEGMDNYVNNFINEKKAEYLLDFIGNFAADLSVKIVELSSDISALRNGVYQTPKNFQATQLKSSEKVKV
ncbi:MAG: hypothetical protein V4471_06545 [Pseudomonadota bacterium]